MDRKAGGGSQEQDTSLVDDANELLAYEKMFSEPGHLIRRLHQISVSIFMEKVKDLDITQVQYATLLTIEFSPGIDQTRLGKAIALDRTTISNVIGRLVAKGLIRREMLNLRTNALFITGAGRAITKVVTPHALSVAEMLLEPLTKIEAKEFQRILKKLIEAKNSASRAPYQALPRVRAAAIVKTKRSAVSKKTATRKII